ncbi:HNH endonuclease signature motif containing protein [Amycolatopsis alkalitolerans]|uniref:DUF222 domain-containing protein n=1 Tax=Amycolatopsis alkalitolerans TaxID=2547244 RepID=A0A5C4LV31_9PSEU|nr:HNH endonuclease signature motif containing protein [Amycolatopsis alkalitolerans]TNC23178.1 DUF222 domain-containing protein [Amycolatopsis alkalitolerans]
MIDDTERWQLPEPEVATMVRTRVEALHRAYAAVLDAVGVFAERNIAVGFGYRDTAAWLNVELRLSRREAKTIVAHAESATPAVNLLGGKRHAELDEAAAALGAGEISREHFDVIHRTFAECPGSETEENRASAQDTMVTAARQMRPEQLKRVSARILHYWQDKEPANPPEDRSRSNRVEYRYDKHGWLRFTGQLDPETAATFEGLLGPLARPRPNPDGSPDARTSPERHGDALAEIVALAARVEDLSIQGGERALMMITVTLDQVRDRLRNALLDVPGLRTPEDVRRLACEAAILPAMFAADGEPLHLGRTQRLASRAQRRALAHRDSGCAFPGCTRGPKWTIAHHIRHWSEGGATDLDNMVLLCHTHHKIVHDTEWEVRLGGGVAEFLPPARIDRARKPIRNLAHAAGPPKTYSGNNSPIVTARFTRTCSSAQAFARSGSPEAIAS